VIDASTTAEANRQELVPTIPHFRLGPPGAGPLIISGTVDLREINRRIQGVWSDAHPWHRQGEDVSALLSQMIERSRRDVARNESSAAPRIDLGLALLKAGELAEAADEFSKALALEPELYVALAHLAQVRVLQGALEEANEIYTRLRKLAPRDSGVLMSLGFLAARNKRWSEALDLLKEACSLDEKAPLPHYNLAKVYLSMGRKREAIAELKTASRTNVRSADFHYGLGVAYALAGDLGRADRCFRVALTLSPQMAAATYGLGIVLLAAGKSQQVVALLTGPGAIKPLNRDGHELLARAYFEVGNYRSAKAALMEAQRLVIDGSEDTTSNMARLANNLGVCAVSLRDSAEAEQLLRASIRLSPDANPRPYHNLARLYISVRKINQAERVLEACRAAFPSDPATQVLLAVTFEAGGSYDKAIAALRTVVELRDAPPSAFAILGALLADEVRNLDEALAVIESGYTRYPHDPIVLNNLAYILLRRGESGRARDVLSRMPERDAATIAPTATSGLLLIAEGDYEGGRQKYRSAERLARQAGNGELAAVVRQKMHLELARALVRRGQARAAGHEIVKGLRVRGRESFRIDLKNLAFEARGLNTP
jgi:tetratricopeptide (TPR) repeat protein